MLRVRSARVSSAGPATGLVATLALAALAGCETRSGVLVATVEFAAQSPSQCVRLELGPPSGSTFSTPGVKRRASGEPLTIAVEPGQQLAAGPIALTAVGYLDSTCQGDGFERSNRAVTTLGEPGVQRVTLTLTGKAGLDGGVDRDGDGVSPPADCDDTDPLIKPGTPEARCGNGKDDDCDGLIDCADPDCDQQACPDTDLCTTGEVCKSGECQSTRLACDDGGVCGSAPGGCDAGTCVYPVAIGRACDADGGVCKSNGSCGTGEVFCNDGLDDDHDGLFDCADPDCQAQTCDAGAACIVDQVCQNDSSCQGVPRTCPQGGSCSTSSSCQEPLGCSSTKTADAGTLCGDGGVCLLDGGCTQHETLCANGLDDDGDGKVDCLDPDCDGLSCSDSNVCTAGERCQASKCDGGMPVVCTTPTNPCLVATACTPASGCTPAVNAYAPCPGGFCLDDAGCGNPFTFMPSSFDPATVAVGPGALVIDCVAEIDTTPGGAMSLCHDGGASFSALPLDGGEALLIATAALIVDGGSLAFYGSRPAVIAVFGNATINDFVSTVKSGAAPFQPAGGDLPGASPIPACALSDGRGADGFSNGGGSPESGGGSGGAYGALSGSGGTGNGQAGGAARQANGAPAVPELRGGCAGGRGGTGGTPPLGGAGGGGLQLSVAGKLTIGATGRVGVPGLGGKAGLPGRAGGGGGSGGALILEAKTFSLAPGAFLTAHGGNGGSGSDNGPGTDGPRGLIASFATPTSTPAPGNAGQGGRGGTRAGGAGDGGISTNNGVSGGGGGGSVGRIRLTVSGQCSYDAGQFSPAPFTNCP